MGFDLQMFFEGLFSIIDRVVFEDDDMTAIREYVQKERQYARECGAIE
jgi:hypothetical protein